MFDRNRFKALVHYTCSQRQADPDSLGAVKLNKILWLSDMVAYAELGKSITGARYVKRQHGPVPHQILPILAELENEKVLKVSEERFPKFRKKVYTVYHTRTGEFLNPEEKGIVDSTIRMVCEEHTAGSISRGSHDDVWKVAADGEEIPYFTVFSRRGEITAEDRDWARQQLSKEL